MQGSLFSGKGTVWILVRSGGEKPFKVMTVDGKGRSVAVTGWCSSQGYVEGKVAKLLEEGWEFAGRADVDSLTDEQRAMFRVTVYHVAELRSAVQKYIRRGQVQKAVDVAYTLLGDRGEMWWLSRRLPVICAEDVGWGYMPALLEVMDDPSEADVIEMAARLAAAEKNKDAGWLVELAVRRKERFADSDRLGDLAAEFVVDGRYVDALACLWLLKDEEVRAASAVLWGLSESEVVRAIGYVCNRRLQVGAGNWDGAYLLACWLLALKHDPPSVWPLPDCLTVQSYVDARHVVDEVDWWCFDQHTWLGKRCIGRVARRVGMREHVLAELMFNYSSAVLSPLRGDEEYRDVAFEVMAKEFGFSSDADAEETWRRVSDDVKECILWHLRRR